MNREKNQDIPKQAARQARIKKNLVFRSKTMGAVRQFFEESGFLEVETPIRLAAPAPEPHIDAVPSGDHYLQASPELHMKRLLCNGYDRIFQICKCFRQKERGSRHLPEFTMLEWYAADADYHFLMDQTEAMIGFVSEKTLGLRQVFVNDTVIDLSVPWRRMRVADAFSRYAGMDMESAVAKDRFEETLAFEIEPRLDTRVPVFLYDYPLKYTPLAKSTGENGRAAQRFELYLAGIEICNGYTELTDTETQRSRFESELAARKLMNRSFYPMPERFLADMVQMPDAAGCALGLDRLVMILSGAGTIDDVTAFVPEDDRPWNEQEEEKATNDAI